MPKIIENVKQNILTFVKQRLLEGNVAELTIANIAQNCGIATGTVFNYFKSKEMIFAAVYLEDWQLTLAQMQKELSSARSAQDAYAVIERGLDEYTARYRKSWQGYDAPSSFMTQFKQKHSLLRDELATLLSPFCAEDVALVLAENLLWISRESEEVKAKVKGVLMRLI